MLLGGGLDEVTEQNNDMYAVDILYILSQINRTLYIHKAYHIMYRFELKSLTYKPGFDVALESFL